MQRGTQDKCAADHFLYKARVISKLASADVATFGKLSRELARAFPTLSFPHDKPTMCTISSDEDYSSLYLIKGLVAATTRGVNSVITPLFSSTSSSCLDKQRDALMCVTSCMRLCAAFMTMYQLLDSGNKAVKSPEDLRFKQVQLAVAVKSAGAPLEHSL
jgi:hypothetical protein